MRRAGRILYNLLTAISLLLLLTTVTVWVRSYWVSDEFSWILFAQDFQGKGIICSRGGIKYSKYETHSPEFHRLQAEWIFHHSVRKATEYPIYQDSSVLPLLPPRYRAIGFEYVPKATAQENSGLTSSASSLTLPLYFPTLLFTLLPAHYFFRTRRRRRRAKRIAQGHCPACNYDLRASPDRCPECGLAATLPPKTIATDAALMRTD